MLDILVRAGCFVGIIILGGVLRKIKFFKEEDFTVLSKIVLRITLPAAIVTSFAGKKVELSMLLLSLMGIGIGAVYIGLAFALNRRKTKEDTIFDVVNLSGYNIGAFTMPFVQSFLGPVGVISTSLFDVGNAFVCLGGSHGIGICLKQGGKLSIKKIIRTMLRSVAFDTYLIMLLIGMAKITLPSPILSFAQLIGNANPFIAMLMIGVGFKLSGDKKKIGRIVRTLFVRYGVGLVFALSCFYLLPFPREVKVALMILAFGPFPSSSPIYTDDLEGDVGLSSALNSISIVCSITFIVIILMVML
ncbi:MAG: AEC family transporter [Tyzzerella sp.]|nr:AEC family transporter [Tyzzerella sp.]